ncbi:glutaredoxin domain-containing cysteine-rich protein CG31559-like [Dreissena polymorpha]|uniref:Glutaredoxin domain-containing protein n=1 Tax=Dreissena polymorpha TaxID=45954 RepID=A0A9D3Y5S5_DREPO|nr:glutaredoxin domain-containing cysteine-rich protein CG31559-like [Dreissena polymorpha]KAH3692278.1 hypothetical protein DPMN_191634 [Dreissena polymorpha]
MCSDEMANDDVKVGNTNKSNSKDVLHIFKRSASEASIQTTMQQMERNYSKLGATGKSPSSVRVKVASASASRGKLLVASLNNLDHCLENGNAADDTEFAGRRDVSNPGTIREKQIVSSRGSIRGVKNRVRAGIATFLEQNGFSRDYRTEEKGKVIVYTTSMTVVRKTADHCKAIRNILQTHMVRYEERDLFMSAENQRELTERLGQSAIVLPQVFADGVHIGDLNAVQHLNETGELRHMFENFTKIQVRSNCEKCGGYRYLPCAMCHGSKKSLHRNDFTEEFCALRCMTCDENGLVRCDLCIDQQE